MMPEEVAAGYPYQWTPAARYTEPTFRKLVPGAAAPRPTYKTLPRFPYRDTWPMRTTSSNVGIRDRSDDDRSCAQLAIQAAQNVHLDRAQGGPPGAQKPAIPDISVSHQGGRVIGHEATGEGICQRISTSEKRVEETSARLPDSGCAIDVRWNVKGAGRSLFASL